MPWVSTGCRIVSLQNCIWIHIKSWFHLLITKSMLVPLKTIFKELIILHCHSLIASCIIGIHNTSVYFYHQLKHFWFIVRFDIFFQKAHNLTVSPWADQKWKQENMTVYEKLRFLDSWQFRLLYSGLEKSRLMGGMIYQFYGRVILCSNNWITKSFVNIRRFSLSV